MAGGTFAPEHCVECIADGPGRRIVAIPFFQIPTKKPSACRGRQPALLARVPKGMMQTYLALVLVGVDELGPVTGHLGLSGRCLLSRTIQSDLKVLDIGAEDCVEITWQRSRYDLKLLGPLRRGRVERMDKGASVTEELVYEPLPKGNSVCITTGCLEYVSKKHRVWNMRLTVNLPI
jgi:hypothetical protein